MEKSEELKQFEWEVKNVIVPNAIKHREEEILELIDNDIEYQKMKLMGNFETDKPIKWRITGFEDLKKRMKRVRKR